MINISTSNKADIKKTYDALFKSVNENDTIESRNLIDTLEMNLKKYIISRGEEWDGTSDIFSDIRYALGHYRNRSYLRKEKIYELLGQLNKKISGGFAKLPLKEKLTAIYSELKEDFKTVCIKGSLQDMDSLTDDFVALQDLAPEMKKYGLTVQESYKQMMRNAGKCQAALPRLMPQEKEGRWFVKTEAINSITNSFEQLYSCVNQVIALLDLPEEKKNKEKKERTSTLEEDQEKALRSEMIQLLCVENWPIDEIARHKNMTVDEVVDILGLE